MRRTIYFNEREEQELANLLEALEHKGAGMRCSASYAIKWAIYQAQANLIKETLPPDTMRKEGVSK